jgi:probable HAF family extracellular repeat protein
VKRKFDDNLAGSVPVEQGSVASSASGINDKGEVVGIYFDSNGVQHGFLYDDGTYTTIDPPGSIETFLQPINNRGELTGVFFGPSTGPQGFVYFHGTYTPLSFLPAWINDKGDMVGSKGDGHGYVYSGGQLTVLDVPGARLTAMVSINDKGQIAGGYLNNGGHDFLYDHGTFYSIERWWRWSDCHSHEWQGRSCWLFPGSAHRPGAQLLI